MSWCVIVSNRLASRQVTTDKLCEITLYLTYRGAGGGENEPGAGVHVWVFLGGLRLHRNSWNEISHLLIWCQWWLQGSMLLCVEAISRTALKVFIWVGTDIQRWIIFIITSDFSSNQFMISHLTDALK